MSEGNQLELERLLIRLIGDTSQFEANMKAMDQKVQKLTKNLAMSGAKATIAITAPITIASKLALNSFRDFDKAMTESTAIMSGVTPEVRAEMDALAKSLSTQGVTSAEDLAKSYYYLAAAGFSVEQSMAALPQMQKFAAAGNFNMALATDLVTDAQSALGLTVSDAAQNLTNLTRVTDVLVRANTLANASVEQFSTSLTTKAGDSLRRVNKDVEEGVAILAAWADQGVKAELAGERLNIVIRDLQTAQRNNVEEWDKLNIKVFDAAGEMLPFVTIIQQFEREMGKMTTEQKGAALAMLGFQDRSVAAFASLVGVSDKIARYEKELRKAGGTTDTVANRQLKSFWSQMQILSNQINLISIEIGQKLAPLVLRLNEYIKKGIEWWNGLNDSTKDSILLWAGVAAAIGPVLLTLASIGKAISFVTTGLAMFGKIGGVAVNAVSWSTRTLSGLFSSASVAVSAMGASTGAATSTASIAVAALVAEAAAITPAMTSAGATGATTMGIIVTGANAATVSLQRMQGQLLLTQGTLRGLPAPTAAASTAMTVYSQATANAGRVASQATDIIDAEWTMVKSSVAATNAGAVKSIGIFSRIGAMFTWIGKTLRWAFLIPLAPFVKVIAIIGGVVAAVSGLLYLLVGPKGLSKAWETLTTGASNFVSNTIGFFANFRANMGSIFNWMLTNWQSILGDMGRLLWTVLTNMASNFRAAVMLLPRYWTAFLGWIVGRSIEVFRYIFSSEFVSLVWNGFTKVISMVGTFAKFVLSGLGTLVSGAVSLFLEIPKIFFGVVQRIGARLGNVLWDLLTGKLPNATEILAGIMDDVGAELQESTTAVGQKMGEAFSGLGSAVREETDKLFGDFADGFADRDLVGKLRSITQEQAGGMRGLFDGFEFTAGGPELNFGRGASQQAQMVQEAMTTASAGTENFATSVEKANVNLEELYANTSKPLNEDLINQFDEFTENLRMQVTTFGMSAREADLFKFQVQGIGTEALESARKYSEFLDALDAQAALMEEGKSVTEQYLTPLERFEQEQAKLQKLLDGNAISSETFDRALADARKTLEGVQEESDVEVSFSGLDAIEAGSAEALARLQEYRANAETLLNSESSLAGEFQIDGQRRQENQPELNPNKALLTEEADPKMIEILESIAQNTDPRGATSIVFKPVGGI